MGELRAENARIQRSLYVKMFTEEDFRRQRQQEILHRALVSLYEDAVPPTHGSLKGRLGELEQEPRVWACGTTTGVADLEVSKNFLAMYRQFPDLYIVNEANKGNEATVYLKQPPEGFRGFVNPLSEEDPYDENLWIGFEKYLSKLMKEERKGDEKPPYVFSRGRYGMACELRKRAVNGDLDIFRRYSLGQLSHIIQLGITQRNLLAYENNELKPVAACKSRTHALLGQPTESRVDDMPYIQNIAELVMCLSKLMPGKPKDRILLSMLKKNVKQVFGRRVDETALGCTKLSSVMELPAVQELFVLEKVSEDNSGLVLRRRETYDVHKVLAHLGDYIGGPLIDTSSLPSLLESQKIKQSRERVGSGSTDDVGGETRKAQLDSALGAWPQAQSCGTAGTWGQALPFGLASQQYATTDRGQPVW